MKKEDLIQVGDLVYHLIHGKAWVALVLNMDKVIENCINRNHLCREYVLVHMQSGSQYEYFFRSSHSAVRVTDSSGLISCHWLRSM